MGRDEGQGAAARGGDGFAGRASASRFRAITSGYGRHGLSATAEFLNRSIKNENVKSRLSPFRSVARGKRNVSELMPKSKGNHRWLRPLQLFDDLEREDVDDVDVGRDADDMPDASEPRWHEPP